MVHLTNQMAMKAPVPNIEEILRTNPDIARQMAAQAMQTQTQQFKQMQQQNMNVPTFTPPPQQNNPLSGLMSFLGGTTQPAPPPQQQSSIKTIPARAPVREMKPPTGLGIGDILKNIQREEKKIAPASTKLPPPPPMSQKGPTLKSALRRSAGSTDSKKSAKNSVVIKL